MNEELLQGIWNDLKERGEEVGEWEDFRDVIVDNPNLLRPIHTDLTSKGEDMGTWAEFSAAMEITPPKAEKNFFDMGNLNDTWLGDWVDDMGRAIARGNRSGDTINETISVMLSRSAVTPENLQSFIEATKHAQELGSSEEMKEFMDAGGFSSWDGFKTFFSNSATIIPELIVESAAGMMGNTVTGSIVGAGAATSAASGGAGAVFAMPAAMGMASGVLETTSKYGELLQQEVADRGLEFDEEGVRTVLEDEEAMKRIQGKALARGITIGMLDGLTGGISATMGAKVVGKGLSKSQKFRKIGGAFAVETAGGAGGEFAAQIVAGESLDITSIGLEAFAEIGSGAPNVLTPIIKDSFRQRNGGDKEAPTGPDAPKNGVLGINPDDVESAYRVNGESATREEAEQIIRDHPDDIANNKIDVEIRNDDSLGDLYKAALNGTRNTEENVDTSDVQGDTEADPETTEDGDAEDSSGPGELDQEGNDVSSEQDTENVEQTQIDADETERTESDSTEEGTTDQNIDETDETQETQAEAVEETTEAVDGLDNQTNNNQDGEENQRDSETQSEGESVQRGGENVQTTDTDPQQESNEVQHGSNDSRPPIDSDQKVDRQDQEEVRQEKIGLRPDEPVGDTAPQDAQSQSAYTHAQVDDATRRVVSEIEAGKSFDEAFNGVKDEFIDGAKVDMNETQFRTAVEAQKRTMDNTKLNELNDNQAYADFESSNFQKFMRWYKRKIKQPLRSTGVLNAEQFATLEAKRGFIQANVGRAKAIGEKLGKLTKDFSLLDKQGVDKMFKGASPDILSADVSPEVREQIAGLTKEMRDRVDGLSRELRELGIFEEPFLEIVRDNEGKYVNRIYMKNVDKNWPKKVPKNVWVTAKKVYRQELKAALQDGRVKDGKKEKIIEILTDDKKMDAFMKQILEGKQGNIFKSGGIQGSKDTSIIKRRKALPPEIRAFYGEVTDAQANLLNTVTKLSSFIANTRMLRDLQAMGLDEGFMSETPKVEGDGRQWVQVNKSNTVALSPLDSPIYMHPDVAEFMQLQRREQPFWVSQALQFNGLVKAGKTIYSPTTQIRNFMSAVAWMAVNGNWNPANFKNAMSIIKDARKTALASDDATTSARIKKANAKWDRMVELQVADQNIVNRELNDFFKSITGDSAREVWYQKMPNWAKKAVEVPRQFYSDVDDFYRISYFLDTETKYADILFNKKVEQLTDTERTQVEETAAQIVRDTYPNYSKIYPLVDKLRTVPFMGAFVSFSAEMIRTTRNQVVQAVRETRSANPKMRINGAKRLIGASGMATLTGYGAILATRMLGTDEETEKDLLQYRPPWVETMIVYKNDGNGKFSYINPSTLNPYGYFSDIANAGKNAGGLLTMKGAAKAVWKTMEPFFGPEITVEVISKELAKAMDDDNPATSGEKIVEASLKILKGLQPGLTYSLGRVVSPKVDEKELQENPDLITEKRWREVFGLLGVRFSDINVTKSFEINKGKQILKGKRRARRKFNAVYYREIDKKEPDMEKVDATYEQSVKIYNEFLKKARDNASRMRRLGISEEKIRESHKKGGVRFDNSSFNNTELLYVFGVTDTLPKLIFKDYNEEEYSFPSPTKGSTRSRRERRSRRSGG